MKKLDIYLGTSVWNYKHLANIGTKHGITSVNIKEGCYKELELITPYEVISDEN